MPSIVASLSRWVKTRKVILLLLLLLALASFLRIYDLGAESIWFDEAHSVSVSSQNFASVIRGAASGHHPPLYFLALHFWISFFGSSEVSLRAISAIFGIISVLITYLIGCALFDRRVGLISSLLSAISLFHIQYSQEARPYSLLLLLSLLSFLFFIQILKRDRKWYYPCYLLFNILLCYTHVFGLFTIAAQISFVLLLWTKYQPQRFKLFALQAATLVAILPLVFLLGHVAISTVQQGFWIPEPSLILILGWIHARSWSETLLVFIFFCLAVIAPFSVRAIEGKWTSRGPIQSLKGMSWNIKLEAIDEFFLVGMWLFLPIVLAFMVSKIIIPILGPRYLIGVSPAFYLLVAKGLSGLNTKKAIYSILIVIVVLSAHSVVNYYVHDVKQQWREVAKLVELNSEENDVTIFCASFVQMPFDYYYQGELVKFGLDKNIKDIQEIAAFVNNAISGKERLWLILSQAPRDPPIESYLTERLGDDSILMEQEFVGVRVLLFDLEENDAGEIMRQALHKNNT